MQENTQDAIILILCFLQTVKESILLVWNTACVQKFRSFHWWVLSLLHLDCQPFVVFYNIICNYIHRNVRDNIPIVKTKTIFLIIPKAYPTNKICQLKMRKIHQNTCCLWSLYIDWILFSIYYSYIWIEYGNIQTVARMFLCSVHMRERYEPDKTRIMVYFVKNSDKNWTQCSRMWLPCDPWLVHPTIKKSVKRGIKRMIHFMAF